MTMTGTGSAIRRICSGRGALTGTGIRGRASRRRRTAAGRRALRQMVSGIQGLRRRKGTILPAAADPVRWNQGKCRGCPAFVMNGGRPGPWVPGESRVRRAVPVNGGKSARRESPAHRAPREPQAHRVPEELRAPGGRQGLPAIPRAAYSPRSRVGS